MKRIVISLLLSMPLAMHAAPDRTVAYFDDMANPIEIKIKPESAPSQVLTIRVEPQKFTQVTIPGGRIAELTINEFEKDKIVKDETLFARKGSLSERVLGNYGYDTTLNYDNRYVIMHNRINPKRAFRLLSPSDVEVRKTVKKGVQTGGAVLLGTAEAVGQGAWWFLTVAALGGR